MRSSVVRRSRNRHHFTGRNWNADLNACSGAGRAADDQGIFDIAVAPQSLLDIRKSEAACPSALQSGSGYANPGIDNRYKNLFLDDARTDTNFAPGEAFADAMFDRIFYQRLDDESGDS